MESKQKSPNPGVISFMKQLKAALEKKYREDYYTGQLYVGEGTITYFPFTPLDLKKLKLKIALVYVYPDDRLEIWLAGQNKNIQKAYWELFRGSDWNKHFIPPTIRDRFSIVESVLAEHPDLDRFEELAVKAEQKALGFIRDVQEVLSTG